MSNMIKSNDDLGMLKDIVHSFHKEEISCEFVSEILDPLIPRENGNPLINYEVNEKGFITGIFYPDSKSLVVGVNRLRNWLEVNSQDLGEYLNIQDIKTLKAFLFLFIFTHEIEHAYEFLMGEGVIVAPSKTMMLGYKGLFDLLKRRDTILPRPFTEIRRTVSLILYKQNENRFVLERNANIESLDTLCQLANYMGRDDILKPFDNMKSTFMYTGYANGTMGSFEETYRKILMYDKYKKIYEEPMMSEDERALYGFAISEEKRKEIQELAKRRV